MNQSSRQAGRGAGPWTLIVGLAIVTAGAAQAGERPATVKPGRAFELTTKSDEARRLLRELQARIENFQFGPDNAALARRIVAADAGFALGHYYLGVVSPPAEGAKSYDQALQLASKASDGEKRLLEILVPVVRQPNPSFVEALGPLEKLAADFPGEPLVWRIVGQIHQAQGHTAKARAAFEHALAVGPPSNRLRALLAGMALLDGAYAQARAELTAVERDLPAGSAPFAVRYPIAFSYLYEGQVEPALEALHTYLGQYRDSGANQGFPEVFIWNSIARINLENGRLPAALEAYEKGYESVVRSSLPEDQKKLWHGRLRHGKCRVLAKQGKHAEAWAEAEEVRRMIAAAGKEGETYLPAYHYLAGYVLLEKGDAQGALEHLKQANADDPFHALLLARALERAGDKQAARQKYQEVTASQVSNLERALAYPEAKRKLSL